MDMKPETYLARERDRLAARRSRARAVFVGVPFMLAGMFAGALGGAQEMPRGMTEDMLEDALRKELEVPATEGVAAASEAVVAPETGADSAPVEPQRSVIPVLIWLVGIGAAAITIPRLRYGALGWAEPAGPTRAAGIAGVSSPTAEAAAPGDADQDGVDGNPEGRDSIVDLGEYRASRRPGAGSGGTAVESFRLPPHVVEMLERNAERIRQTNRAPDVRLADSAGSASRVVGPSGDQDSGGLDIVVPRYDPRGGS